MDGLINKKSPARIELPFLPDEILEFSSQGTQSPLQSGMMMGGENASNFFVWRPQQKFFWWEICPASPKMYTSVNNKWYFWRKYVIFVGNWIQMKIFVGRSCGISPRESAFFVAFVKYCAHVWYHMHLLGSQSTRKGRSLDVQLIPSTVIRTPFLSPRMPMTVWEWLTPRQRSEFLGKEREKRILVSIEFIRKTYRRKTLTAITSPFLLPVRIGKPQEFESRSDQMVLYQL